jgi:dynein heavy chain
MSIIYPKAVGIAELFGYYSELTREWNDGIVNAEVRKCLRRKELSWIVLDGPVDPLWIENLNSVLDDSKKLCLNSGESLILHDKLQLLFEVDSLLYASPATVSRCGMIYMEAASLPL